jgi:hypothetical protein
MLREPQQIGGDPHLPITAIARPDPDHGDGEPLAQQSGQIPGNVFHHEGKTAHPLKLLGLLEQPLAGAGIRGLPPQSEAMHRLGGEAQMAHHRNSHPHHAVDGAESFRLRSLQLHRCCRALLQDPARRGQSILQAALIAEEGKVADHQGHRVAGTVLKPPAHRPTVVQHFLQGDRQGGGVTQDRHAQGVTDKYRINTGFPHDLSGDGIPGRQDRDGKTGLFADLKIAGALWQWERVVD